MIKLILFDLDGTLLPLDQKKFVDLYVDGITKKAAKQGYDKDVFGKNLWKAINNMAKNDGKQSNEDVFWATFTQEYGTPTQDDKDFFIDYYVNEFSLTKKSAGYEPMSRCVIDILKAKGYKLVLATQPVFPAIATETRMRWAGLDREDFELYTTFENSNYTKPNPEYYKAILKRFDCKPQDCLMVGNDVDDDMIAGTLGINTFLLTNNLINKNNVDINQFKHGNFNDLLTYIDSLQ